jgi:predicted nucleic acid-binding Zn ribbon protein
MSSLRNVYINKLVATSSRNSTGWVVASYRSRSLNRPWAPSLSRRDLQKATVCTHSVCFKAITQNCLTGTEECRKIMSFMTVEMRAKSRTMYLPYTSRERCHYAKLPGLLRHIRFLGAFPKLRKAAISFMSVCLSAWNNSAFTGRIFVKFGIWVCFENLSRKFKFH